MIFMDEGPSKATVHRWYNEFKCGRLTLRDIQRSGRPLTAVTKENLLAVKISKTIDELCIRRFNTCYRLDSTRASSREEDSFTMDTHELTDI